MSLHWLLCEVCVSRPATEPPESAVLRVCPTTDTSMSLGRKQHCLKAGCQCLCPELTKQ